MSKIVCEMWLRLVTLKINIHGKYSCASSTHRTWSQIKNSLHTELKRSMGRDDRKNRRGCRSSDGSYIEGYHDDSPARLQDVTWSELEELRR